MESVVLLCGAGCQCCPAVGVTQTEVTIGEGDNIVKLTPEQWDFLVEKVKSGELTTFEKMAAACGCGCGCED